MGAASKARQYDALKTQSRMKAEMTRLKGKTEAAEAQSDARSIYEQDVANRYLRGMQQRQARREETLAKSAARNKTAASGTNVEQGASLEENVRIEWDAQIANMAVSSSIQTANAMQRAIDTERSGQSAERWANVEAMGYDAQANQYRTLARNTRKSMWASSITMLAGALYGGIQGYSIGDAAGLTGGDLFMSTLAGAGQYGDMGWDMGSMMNPYMGGYTVDARRSGSLFYSMLGRNTYYPENTPYV